MSETTPDSIPRDGNVLDLDAHEHARREGRGDGLEVKWKGTAYRLPVELPMEAVEQLSSMADVGEVDENADPAEAAAALRLVSKGLDGGLAVLFCTCDKLPERKVAKASSHTDAGCQWPTFQATRPSLETRMALVNGVWAAYGVTLGEALAPTQQLAAGGRQSAQTSRTSTGSTPATSGAGTKAPTDRQAPAARKRAAAKRAPAKRAAAPRARKAAE